MKILEKQSYQTYSALIAYEYIVEHEGEKYCVIHNVTDEGEESFYAYNVDGNSDFERQSEVSYLRLKKEIISHVSNMYGEC